MSRFDDGDDPGDLESLLAQGRWMGRRKAVLNGRPGKAALAELEQVLLAMPHKRLIEGSLCDGTGVCANGAWLYRHWVDGGLSPREAWRKLKTEGKDRYFGNSEGDELDRTVAMTVKELGVTKTLAELVAYINDEEVWAATPERRYAQVLERVQRYMRLGV